MKNPSLATIADDLTSCLTSDELKTVGEIFSQASARSAVHAEETQNRIDARCRRERSSRLQKLAKAMFQGWLTKAS